jgi:peptidoglycan hydrolase-like protein with peptidoglycan-binding domain
VRNYTAAIGTAVVAAVCFQIQYAVFGLIALVGSVLLALRRSNAEQEVQKRIDQAITGWGNIQVKWRQAAGNSDFSHARQEADRLITELQNLGGKEARRMADLRARQRDTQLTQFLQQYYIGKATIRGIGRNRKIVLRSYGIETAADVDPHRIQQISGFGPVIAGKLVSWRRSIERRFAFNPNQPIPPIEIANVRNAIARKRSEFERKLKQSFEQLQRALHDILASRNSLQAAAIQVWKAKKQAELDKLAVANSFSLVPRLAGIFGVIVAIYALSQSFHTTTKASAPIGAKTEKPTITQPAIREPLQQGGTVPASVPATQRKTESLGGGTAREVGRVGPPSDTKWPTVTQPSSTPLKPATDTREQVRPPLDMKVATPADSPHQPTSTGGILTQKRDEGGGPTRTTLSAPTNLKSAAQQPVRLEARATAIRPELLSREELIHIQTRLRQVGFIGTVDGLWNQRTQEAIRQFKITNRLSNPDLWDPETDEKLKSPAAIRAHESFIGAWSEHPCRGTDVTRPPLRITSRRASSSDGGVCEFSNFDFQDTDWRVRALCTVGKNSWTTNITFAVKGNQLTWSSERGVSTYHRCI